MALDLLRLQQQAWAELALAKMALDQRVRLEQGWMEPNLLLQMIRSRVSGHWRDVHQKTFIFLSVTPLVARVVGQ